MEDQAISIDWSLLLPIISSNLLDSEITTEDLSAYSILLMLAVAIVAALYVTIRAFKANQSVRFLLSLLKNVSPETLAQQRREILIHILGAAGMIKLVDCEDSLSVFCDEQWQIILKKCPEPVGAF